MRKWREKKKAWRKREWMALKGWKRPRVMPMKGRNKQDGLQERQKGRRLKTTTRKRAKGEAKK